MPISRYKNSPILSLGKQYGTSRIASLIRIAMKRGTISVTTTLTLQENQRLDHLSARYYKDSGYWWVIAAASDIGWGLQVPAGTFIVIPEIDSIISELGL